jgi:hypothetical protein
MSVLPEVRCEVAALRQGGGGGGAILWRRRAQGSPEAVGGEGAPDGGKCGMEAALQRARVITACTDELRVRSIRVTMKKQVLESNGGSPTFTDGNGGKQRRKSLPVTKKNGEQMTTGSYRRGGVRVAFEVPCECGTSGDGRGAAVRGDLTQALWEQRRKTPPSEPARFTVPFFYLFKDLQTDSNLNQSKDGLLLL